MVTSRRNAVRFGVLLLIIAGLIQGNLPTSFAQSSSGRTKSTYFVMGAVKNPGVYRIEADASVLTLLALAGGLENRHGPVALSFARHRHKQQTRILLTRLLTNGKQKDIPLLPSDIIVIPNSRAGNNPLRRFLDAPPVPVLYPCRGARPCMAWFDSVKPVSGKN